jgi:hypothetical protein
MKTLEEKQKVTTNPHTSTAHAPYLHCVCNIGSLHMMEL